MARKKKPVLSLDPEPNGEPEAEQAFLPEMAPETIPEVEAAAKAFQKARNAWQTKHPPMMEAREILIAAMKEHKLTVYRFKQTTVELTEDARVKVKTDEEE